MNKETVIARFVSITFLGLTIYYVFNYIKKFYNYNPSIKIVNNLTPPLVESVFAGIKEVGKKGFNKKAKDMDTFFDTLLK